MVMTDPSRSCAGAVSPRITTENSPRAMSAVPARSRPRGPAPSRRAAYHPVATSVTAVTTARASAAGGAGRRSPGSADMPSARKNTAANRSRSGPRTERARSAAGPVSARPTRKAPTAADTWTTSAGAATVSVIPRSLSSTCSASAWDTTRPAW